MKTTKIMTLALVAIMSVTQFSCKKDKVETPTPPVVKKYLPTSILVQNATTAATIQTNNITYNSDASIVTLERIAGATTINWTFNYNQNGTLKTATYTHSTSGTSIYNLSYDGNNRLNKIQKTGASPDMLNLNYVAATNTYVGTGGNQDGTSIKLDMAGQLESRKYSATTGGQIDLTYQNSQKGVFADANITESFLVFSIAFGDISRYSYFHKQQLDAAVETGTFFGGSSMFQNYNRDANGYITSYLVNGSSTFGTFSQSYTMSYTEL